MFSTRLLLLSLIITLSHCQDQPNPAPVPPPTPQVIPAQPNTIQPQVVQPVPAPPTLQQPINININVQPTPVTVEPTQINTQQHQTNQAVPQAQQIIPQTQTVQQIVQNNQQNINTNTNSNINNNINQNSNQIPQQTQQTQKSYHQSNEQRSARYRAQQQRLQAIRKKQQQQQVKYAQDAKISRYQQARNKQRQQLRNVLASQTQFIPKKTVLCEVGDQIQEFIINPISSHKVIISMLLYTLQNNAYGFVKDIDNTKALRVYIFEDNNRIIGESEFYFEKAIQFQVKKGSYYSIRFYNQGQHKLVSFTYPSLIQSTHIDNIYNKQKGQYHLYKANVLGVRVQEITDRLKRNSLLDKINNQTMMGFLKKYSGYQFVEMLVLIVVCGFQVHMVKKLFKTDSIL